MGGESILGFAPARCPFTVSFLGEGPPTKIDHRKKGTLILTFLLDDLKLVHNHDVVVLVHARCRGYPGVFLF